MTDNLVKLVFADSMEIDASRLDAALSARQLTVADISSTDLGDSQPQLEEHAAEPIKRLEDIDRISTYLVAKERYRDNMLFIVGINFGLRISDLLKLRFNSIIDDNLRFRDTFAIFEQKTSHTRTKKRNRYITINDAVVEAVTLYLRHHKCKLDDFMFRSESNRGSNVNRAMSRMTADRILKGVAKELKLDIRMSTHSLRKTFGYHQMMMANNDPRKLLLLQKMFGHSTSAQTLDYIGITEEEIEDAYLGLNLGGNDYSKARVIRNIKYYTA